MYHYKNTVVFIPTICLEIQNQIVNNDKINTNISSKYHEGSLIINFDNLFRNTKTKL